MNIKTWTTQKVATKLKNPKVRFNSFVNHAATKIPFARIKQENTLLLIGDEAMTQNSVLQKVAFEKEFFTREKADEILADIGFENYVFSETDKTLTVVNDSADQEKESKDIPGKVQGLTFFVYKEDISEVPVVEEKTAPEIKKSEKEELPRFRELEDSTPNSEQSEVAVENADKKSAKKPAKTSQDKPEKDKDKKSKKKYDGWDAYCSTSDSVSGVLSDADDGTPIGFYELTNAMTIAVANSLKKSDYAGVQKACLQFSDALVAVDKTYRGLVTPETESMKAAGELSKEEIKYTEALEALKAELASMKEELKSIKDNSSVVAVGSKSIQEDLPNTTQPQDVYKAERLKREALELEKDRKYAEKLRRNVIGIK